jgi:hypothetical protein
MLTIRACALSFTSLPVHKTRERGSSFARGTGLLPSHVIFGEQFAALHATDSKIRGRLKDEVALTAVAMAAAAARVATTTSTTVASATTAGSAVGARCAGRTAGGARCTKRPWRVVGRSRCTVSAVTARTVRAVAAVVARRDDRLAHVQRRTAVGITSRAIRRIAVRVSP